MPRVVPFVVLLLSLLACRPAFADDLKLAWDPPTDAVTDGYVMFVGNAPGVYSRQLRIGKVTSHTVGGLTPGVTYYFVIRAYDAEGRLSGPSNEVTGRVAPATVPVVPPPTPTVEGCTTPDPFVVLGGGTCRDGGWLPPGMLPRRFH